MPKTTYKVRLDFITDSDKPPNALRDYIRNALESWSGQLEPPNEENDWTGDPMWGTHKAAFAKRYPHLSFSYDALSATLKRLRQNGLLTKPSRPEPVRPTYRTPSLPPIPGPRS